MLGWFAVAPDFVGAPLCLQLCFQNILILQVACKQRPWAEPQSADSRGREPRVARLSSPTEIYAAAHNDDSSIADSHRVVADKDGHLPDVGVESGPAVGTAHVLLHARPSTSLPRRRRKLAGAATGM